MLDRLTNPLISLHEAGVLLRVCAATVRRYSNSGLLKHERTAGGQRRFRLREVLALVEEREAQRRPSPRHRQRRHLAAARLNQARLSAARSSHAPERSGARDPRELLAATRARAQAALSQAAAQNNASRGTAPPLRTALHRLPAAGLPLPLRRIEPKTRDE